jgi:hypothetical protein
MKNLLDDKIFMKIGLRLIITRITVKTYVKFVIDLY